MSTSGYYDEMGKVETLRRERRLAERRLTSSPPRPNVPSADLNRPAVPPSPNKNAVN